MLTVGDITNPFFCFGKLGGKLVMGTVPEASIQICRGVMVTPTPRLAAVLAVKGS